MVNVVAENINKDMALTSLRRKKPQNSFYAMWFLLFLLFVFPLSRLTNATKKQLNKIHQSLAGHFYQTSKLAQRESQLNYPMKDTIHTYETKHIQQVSNAHRTLRIARTPVNLFELGKGSCFAVRCIILRGTQCGITHFGQT